MEIELKLTSSGTPREVINSLKRLIKHLEGCSLEELEHNVYEDADVYAEAKELEPV